MFEIIGQGLGIAAVVFGFVSYQMKTPNGILICQLATSLIFAAHYYFIGDALTAVALNMLGAVKCGIYLLREKREGKSVAEPIIFMACTVVTSILTWRAWYTVFIMVGLLVDTISLALSNPQKTRYCMLLKTPLCGIYNGIVSSVGGVIYESVVLISSVIGIINNRSSRVVDENDDDAELTTCDVRKK